MVVGDSTTGEMDKIDGPYYFFASHPAHAQILPPWMPSIGLEGGRASTSCRWISVVDALDHIAHTVQGSGRRFHLVDPVGLPVGARCSTSSAARRIAPKMNVFVNAALLGFIPRSVKKGLMAPSPGAPGAQRGHEDLGLPEDMPKVKHPSRRRR